jgi:hypothetical protein
MTHIELEQYVKSLAARVAELEARPIARLPEAGDKFPVNEAPKESGRQMCPHCGVKPNHFFHVRTCNANKKKNNGEKETPS